MPEYEVVVGQGDDEDVPEDEQDDNLSEDAGAGEQPLGLKIRKVPTIKVRRVPQAGRLATIKKKSGKAKKIKKTKVLQDQLIQEMPLLPDRTSVSDEEVTLKIEEGESDGKGNKMGGTETEIEESQDLGDNTITKLAEEMEVEMTPNQLLMKEEVAEATVRFVPNEEAAGKVNLRLTEGDSPLQHKKQVSRLWELSRQIMELKEKLHQANCEKTKLEEELTEEKREKLRWKNISQHIATSCMNLEGRSPQICTAHKIW